MAPSIMSKLQDLLLGRRPGRGHSRAALASEAAPAALNMDRFRLERLEPRLLLSATPIALAAPSGPKTYTVQLQTPSGYQAPTLDSNATNATVQRNAIVGVLQGHDTAKYGANSSAHQTDGKIYQYLGNTSATLNLSTTDFDDTTKWQVLEGLRVKVTDIGSNGDPVAVNGSNGDLLAYGSDSLTITAPGEISLTLDDSLFTAPQPFNITVTGGGNNTIKGPSVATTWRVTGDRAGRATIPVTTAVGGVSTTVNRTVTFTGVSAVVAGTGTDTLSADTVSNGLVWEAGEARTVKLRNITFSDVEQLAGNAGDTFDANRVPVQAPDANGALRGVEVDLKLGLATGYASISGFTILQGGAGDDTLTAGSVAATLRGGAGNDLLVVGTAVDRVEGGDGTDILSAEADASFVLVNGNLTITPVGGTQLIDSFIEIEKARLTGGASNNILDASVFSGSTTLDGGTGGNDTLRAGQGRSLLIVRSGNDSLFGGAGDDTVLSARNATMTLTNTSLEARTATGDATGTVLDTSTLTSIEHAELDSASTDRGAKLDASAFSLGTVTLSGGAAADTLLGANTRATRFITGVRGNSIVGGTSLVSGEGPNVLEANGIPTVTLTDTSLIANSSATIYHLVIPLSASSTSNFPGFTLTVGSQSQTLAANATAEQVKAAFLLFTGMGTTDDIQVDTYAAYPGVFDITRKGTTAAPEVSVTAAAGVDARIWRTKSSTKTDTISGISQADLYGTTGSDSIDAAQFTRRTNIWGLGGAMDTLIGSATAVNAIVSGDGNSIIQGGAAADTLTGGNGINQLFYIGAGDIRLTDTQLLHGGVTTTISGFVAATLKGSGSAAQTIDASGFSGIVAGTDVRSATPLIAIASIPLSGLTTDINQNPDLIVTLHCSNPQEGRPTYGISLYNCNTLQDVLDNLNGIKDSQGNQLMTAALDAQHRIVLTDRSTGSTTFSIAASGTIRVLGQEGATILASDSLALSALKQLGLGTTTASTNSAGKSVLTGTALSGAHVTLVAGSAPTTLRGGAGDDSFEINDDATQTIEGKGGRDSVTLRFDSDVTVAKTASSYSITSVKSGVTRTATLTVDSITGGSFDRLTLARGTGTTGRTVNGTAFTGHLALQGIRSNDILSLPADNEVAIAAGQQAPTIRSGAANYIVTITGGDLHQSDIDNWVSSNGAGTVQFNGSSYTINEALYTYGRSIGFKSDSVTIGASGSINTTRRATIAGAAGDITIKAHTITVSTGASLIASDSVAGHTDGNITLHGWAGAEAGATWTPMVNVSTAEAKITVGNAQIRGKTITIDTQVDSSLLADEREQGSVIGPFRQDFTSNLVNLINSLQAGFGLSMAKTTSTIDVAANIQASVAVMIAARVYNNVAASPFAFKRITLAAVAIDTVSTVTFTGTITTTGDVSIGSSVVNALNLDLLPGPTSLSAGGSDPIKDTAGKIVLESYGAKSSQTGSGFALAGGAVVLLSKNLVTTSGTISAANAFITASTVDEPKLLIQTYTGPDGLVAAGLAVEFKYATTKVTVGGKVTLTGGLTATASEATKSSDLTRFMLPTGAGLMIVSITGAGTDGGYVADAYAGLRNRYMTQYGALSGTVAAEKSANSCFDWFKGTSTAKDVMPITAWDAGVGIGLVLETNYVDAIIADNATITTGGDLTLRATIDSRIKNAVTGSVGSEVSNSTKERLAAAGKSSQADAKLGVALGVSYSQLDDQTHATIGAATVNVRGKLTVNAESRAAIDPLSLPLVNLLTGAQAASAYDYTSAQTVDSLRSGMTVRVPDAKSPGVYTLYKYKGPSRTGVNLSSEVENYNNDLYWDNLGNPDWNGAKAEFSNFFGVLSDTAGQKGFFNSWGQSRTRGQKVGIAIAGSVIVYDHVAKAEVNSGARINQSVLDANGEMTSTSAGSREVSITAASITHLANLVGNFQQFGLPNDFQTNLKLINNAGQRFLYPTFSQAKEKAIGFSIGIYKLSADTEAVIHNGAKVYGDNIAVGAATQTAEINFAASGGTGAATQRKLVDGDGKTLAKPEVTDSKPASNFAFNGSFVISMLDNTTIAQIEDGAKIRVGATPILTRLQTFDQNKDKKNQLVVGTIKSTDMLGHGVNYYATKFDTGDNSLYVGADDNSWLFSFAGALNESSGSSMGVSAAGTWMNRTTKAIIGDAGGAADQMVDLKSRGGIVVNALNEGMEVGFAAAGTTVSTPDPAPPAAPAAGGNSVPPIPSASKDGKGNALDELKEDIQGGLAAAPGGGQASSPQAEAGVGITGSFVVNLATSRVTALVGGTTQSNLAAIDTDGVFKSLTINASDATVQLAGAGSMARNAQTSGTSIAGAVAVNHLEGEVTAKLSGFNTVAVGALSVTANNLAVALGFAAGYAGASGEEGSAAAISFAMAQDWQNYWAEISNITLLTAAGNVDVKIKNRSGNSAFAGAFGNSNGNLGFGLGFGFVQVTSQMAAQILDVRSMRRSGDVTVSVDNFAVVVVIGAGIGIGHDEIGGALTAAVAQVASPSTALISNSTLHDLSGWVTSDAGAVSVTATDESTVVTVSGAIASGGRGGFGIALALNLVGNTMRAAIVGTTIARSTAITVRSKSTDVLVAVALSGANANDAVAVGGSFAVTRTTNTLTSEVGSYDPGNGGSRVNSHLRALNGVTIVADDDNTSVNLAGGLARSGSGVGVGAGVAVVQTEDHVTARVFSSSVAGDATTPTILSTAGAVTITARTSMTDAGVGIGGALADKLAIGGSVVVVTLTNTVTASIDSGAKVWASRDVLLSAVDESLVVVIAGAGAASTGSAAVGAAFGVVNAQNTFRAIIDGGEVTSNAGSVAVMAGYFSPGTGRDTDVTTFGVINPVPTVMGGGANVARQGDIINIAIAGAGASRFAGGAAFTLTWMRNTIQAQVIGGAKVSAAGDIIVRARDSVVVGAAAVGAAGAGTGAMGAAFAYNYVGGAPDIANRVVNPNPALDEKGTIQAVVDGVGTILTAGRTATVSAEALSKLVSVTIGAAGAGTAAVAGSFSTNFERYQIISRVTGGARITATGAVVIRALLNPSMIIVAGAGAGAGTAAVGLVMATNDLRSDLRAYVEGRGTDVTQVTSTTGSVTVRAAMLDNKSEFDDTSGTSGTDWLSISGDASADGKTHGATPDAAIWSFAVSGAAGGTAAVTGSSNANWVRTTIDAHIGIGATVTALAGTVTVAAVDTARIRSIAGAFNAAGVAAVGAAFSINRFGSDPDKPTQNDNNTIKAYISAATVSARDVAVLASSTNDVLAIAISGGAAGNVSVQAAIAANQSNKEVSAKISSGAQVTATGNLTLDAYSASTIGAIAIGVAGAGVAGVGGSLTKNLLRDDVTAQVDGTYLPLGSTPTRVTVNNNMRVSALTMPGINAAGGAVGGGKFAGLGGTLTINEIGGTTLATINNGAIVVVKGLSTSGIAVNSWATDRDGTRNASTVRGLAVIADTRESVSVYFGSGGGGFVGGAMNLSFVKTSGTTQASIENSTINSDAFRGYDVVVRAHYLHQEDVVSVALSGGLAGVAVASSDTKLDHTTSASIAFSSPYADRGGSGILDSRISGFPA